MVTDQTLPMQEMARELGRCFKLVQDQSSLPTDTIATLLLTLCLYNVTDPNFDFSLLAAPLIEGLNSNDKKICAKETAQGVDGVR